MFQLANRQDKLSTVSLSLRKCESSLFTDFSVTSSCTCWLFGDFQWQMHDREKKKKHFQNRPIFRTKIKANLIFIQFKSIQRTSLCTKQKFHIIIGISEI